MTNNPRTLSEQFLEVFVDDYWRLKQDLDKARGLIRSPDRQTLAGWHAVVDTATGEPQILLRLSERHRLGTAYEARITMLGRAAIEHGFLTIYYVPSSGCGLVVASVADPYDRPVELYDAGGGGVCWPEGDVRDSLPRMQGRGYMTDVEAVRAAVELILSHANPDNSKI